MVGLNLNYMSGGNKAWVLTLITTLIIVLGAVVFVVGPSPTLTQAEPVTDDFFSQLADGNTLLDTPQPGAPSRSPSNVDITRPPSQPLAQTLPPNLFVQSGSPPPVTPLAPIVITPVPVPTATVPQITPAPISRPPSPVWHPQPTTSSTTGPPITSTPVLGTVRQYPFAVVFECDWQGNRLSLTTKTVSSSVIRLCIEAPPLPATEAPVEISFLNWLVFTRQAYETTSEPLPPVTQHAVLAGKPDPFGLTVLRCPAGVAICRVATDLRNEFFTEDAYLVGRGELALQYVQEPKAIAGISPISIYFLLSSIDIPEPIQLGRSSSASTGQSAALSYSRPVGTGRRKQNAFLSHENNINHVNIIKEARQPP
jgi:hypothetical protein